jgi:hypothetical protein
MSDITSLSSNYSATATFAKEFNGAVLILKRRHLAHEALPVPPAEEEAHARKQLSEYLRGIVRQLAPEASSEAAADRIPEAVISRLAEKHQNKMAWFVADIGQVRRTIDEGKPLVENDFAALDEVCDAADATASASFRRLWRR